MSVLTCALLLSGCLAKVQMEDQQDATINSQYMLGSERANLRNVFAKAGCFLAEKIGTTANVRSDTKPEQSDLRHSTAILKGLTFAAPFAGLPASLLIKSYESPDLYKNKAKDLAKGIKLMASNPLKFRIDLKVSLATLLDVTGFGLPQNIARTACLSK